MPSDEHGMPYNDVKRRLKRIQRTERQGKVKNPQLKSNLEESLKRQVARRDGKDAVKEINKEMAMNVKSYSGRYLRSCGYGESKRGKLEGWEEISPGHYRRKYT